MKTVASLVHDRRFRGCWQVLGLLVLCAAFAAPAQAQRSSTEKAGDAGLVLLPVAAYGAAVLAGDRGGRRQFHRAFLLNFATTLALKQTVSKTRPDGSDTDSFPSAHTSITFQSAAWVQRRYGWKFALPAYSVAGFVGYSRVDADKHHVEDVLAGAAIGVVASLVFTRPYGPVAVVPVAGADLIGVRFQARW